MEDLKICLISIKIAPDCERTGFEGIYDYLIKKGYDVKLLTGKWNYILNDPNIIQYHILKSRYLWAPEFVYRVAKYLNTHKFDIIHGNKPKSSLPILFSNKKKFISTIHDLGPFEAYYALGSLQKLLVSRIVQESTYITVPSYHTKLGLKNVIPKLNLSKIKVIYNGIDKKFHPRPNEAKKLKQKFDLKGPIILYLGRIARYKGVEDIIKAYIYAKKKIKNLTLIIAGKPDFEMQNTYNLWKKKYQRILFTGFIPDDLVPVYYSMADILIAYSSGSEGFGNTPLEALACGTAVICSNLDVYKEILDEKAVFVPVKSPRLLSDQIIYLLENRDAREQLIKKGQEILPKYTWDAMGKRLEKIYFTFNEE
ncbi:MAG: GDP-mannose-dependent alpha-(1-6)-phosphatidylinositol monomannoside mannosyltransferase [Promethearchaeota archaeon]|nr:MAG: GDP-mannose-dependent alpha-(1-6)-phosphatidylinositol monomannoside mannosyltransferase [Candidatus Lokiarchaeota archaeon]